MKRIIIIFILMPFVCFMGCNQSTNKTETETDETTEGWNILTDNDSIAVRVIEEAPVYDLNHLQLSHSIVMDLRDVKEKKVADKVNRLTKLAHDNNIKEVTIWDHSLYGLDGVVLCGQTTIWQDRII